MNQAINGRIQASTTVSGSNARQGSKKDMPSIPAAACAEWVTETVRAAGVTLAETLSPSFCAAMTRHCCSTLLSW